MTAVPVAVRASSPTADAEADRDDDDTVTESAARQILKLHREAVRRMRRVCAWASRPAAVPGFEYVFAWEAAPRENDLVFEGPSGVRVWIDPRSHRLLDGTTLDYDTSLLSRGFVFENPHAKSTCGCGTSFFSVS